ncbi:MAG: hypothetical protein P1V35_12830, partial [Planctomycetota bacterium]|nr:hypothetical protein [Planctomycetota bacterium]
MGELRSQAMDFHKEPDPPRKKRKRSASPLTCLTCFHPFSVKGASEDCPECGARNLRVDQMTFWNQDPVIMRVEGTAKALVCAVLGALTFFMLTTIHGGGMGQGWAIAFPVILGWILWDALGLLTRRTSMLNHRVLWPWLCACVGIGPALFILATLISAQQYNILETLGGVMLWAIAWTIPAFALHLLGNKLSDMRTRR